MILCYREGKKCSENVSDVNNEYHLDEPSQVRAGHAIFSCASDWWFQTIHSHHEVVGLISNKGRLTCGVVDGPVLGRTSLRRAATHIARRVNGDVKAGSVADRS